MRKRYAKKMTGAMLAVSLLLGGSCFLPQEMPALPAYVTVAEAAI